MAMNLFGKCVPDIGVYVLALIISTTTKIQLKCSFVQKYYISASCLH